MATEYKIRCEKEITITSEDIDDIMSDALDFGIGYWCERAEVQGEYLGSFASDQISRGGELLLYPDDEDEPVLLNLEKFLKGYKMSVEEGYFSGDVDEYDADIADVIVQLAVFDDVVYG